MNYFKIETAYAHYFVKIQYNGDFDRVFFGAKRKCVVIDFLHDETEHPHIAGVSFDENCSIQGDLLRGVGTLHMLSSCMQFVLEHYKPYKIKGFTLCDTAVIECKKSFELSLAKYYLAFYGKTWYESKLRARPDRQEEALKFTQEKDEFGKAIKMKPVYNNLMRYASVKIKTDLQEHFDKAATMHEFLKTVRQLDKDCSMYRQWLEEYVDQYIKAIPKYWFIERGFISKPEGFSYKKVNEQPGELFVLRGGNSFGLWIHESPH
jgi:hypothetical protein